MKENTTVEPSSDLQSGRPVSDLQITAGALARFFEEFGIYQDERFGERAAALAFLNGVAFGASCADEVASLEERLTAEGALADAEVDDLVKAIAALPLAEGECGGEIRRLLDHRVVATAEGPIGSRQPACAILGAVHVGLRVSRTQPETAKRLAELWGRLTREIQFLTTRLPTWSGNGLRPRHAPFVEFVAFCYPRHPIERQVMCTEILEVLPVAEHSSDPWDARLWMTLGWAKGRAFARGYSEMCRKLLEEAPADELRTCHRLYEEFVLGTALPGGEIRIERATLAYFAGVQDGGYARLYCSGEQPRFIARVAFDFAFWMGIFSVFPVPLREAETHGASTEGQS
jgi:hypothetical protein